VLTCDALLSFVIICYGLLSFVMIRDAFERKHGADAQVRLATKLVFLAGIYSKIGAAKGPVRITREEIWRRALGFKSTRVFSVEMRRCQVCITSRQARSIIDRLQDRGFFARITYARRQTYYSHRLTADQLADAIVTRKLQRERARQARIRANDALTKRVQTDRRRLAAPFAADGATQAAT
jgi:hypothetical protein